ncbi:MAG TPA: methyltransferase [Stellaceae bacterium]|nr:methyltransferase [Stellaceae bacterium]
MPDITPDPIMKIAMGFMAAKHLFAANEIGLFESLAAGPASIAELATKTTIPSRTLGIVANAMVSLGLVERQGDQYRNSETAAVFLAGRPGPDLRPMLRFWNRISYPTWQKLEAAVRTGAGQAQFGLFNKEEQQIFSAGVEAFTAPVAAALAASYDFSRHRRVLDVGGGTGSFLVGVLRRHSALKGTLFELPGACEVARQRLAHEPEGARIEIVAGDAFKDPLPEGHDALIVANTIHVLSAAHNIELLRRMRSCVSAGARLLLADLWTDPTHTQPPAAPLMSGEFLVISGEGQAYSEAEAEDWLGQTGWQKIERKPLAGPGSLIVAEAK